jgi:NAD(P)H-hydrate repair Nnr-like enzyme with NAD(P)H-hydrate dehydratase domain
VLDAAALADLTHSIGELRRRPSGVVITPHPGEMAHLVGLPEAEVEARAEEIAGEAARRFGVVVALKSARTHVASPDGLSVHLDEGKIGLATAGSGDVLAGVIAGLLARGADPFAAAAWGVFLHREAGIRLARRLGPIGYLARELLQELPRALAES